MMTDQAFSVFIQHWLIDENNAKRRMYKKKSLEAFEHFVMNRRIMMAVDHITQLFLFQHQVNLEIRQMAQFIAKDVIFHRRVYGICTLCEEGIVQFFQTGNDLEAICSSCHEIFFIWFNIFL